MPLITCSDCAKEHSDAAAACPNCGRPAAGVGVVAAMPTPRRVSPLLLLLLVVLVLAMGKIRVVSGTESFLIPRGSFGYSDMFASVDACTSGPWIAVAATHGPLCKDLQAAGILESDEAREKRIRRDMDQRMEEARRRMDAIMRR